MARIFIAEEDSTGGGKAEKVESKAHCLLISDNRPESYPPLPIMTIGMVGF
jgi:hypothetical protein